MKAIKCDRCGRFALVVSSGTLVGIVARWAIGDVREGGPLDKYDLCPTCGEALADILQQWWKMGPTRGFAQVREGEVN